MHGERRSSEHKGNCKQTFFSSQAEKKAVDERRLSTQTERSDYRFRSDTWKELAAFYILGAAKS